MRRNVELKARLANLQAAREIARTLAGPRQAVLEQVDTYFCCPQGRLKLREIRGTAAELIWYDRPDQQATTLSRFLIAPVNDSVPLRAVLQAAYPVEVEVRKRRELHLWENVRIHLDQVDQLGDFLEFEAVLAEGAEEAPEHHRLAELADAFGLADADRVDVGYRELRLARESGG